MNTTDLSNDMPVVADRGKFDARSGNLLERAVFNHRGWLLLLCALVTVLLGWQATQLKVNASFEKMIPQSHPYVRNYLDNRKDLAGLSNSVRVAVENPNGDVFDPHYLATLAKVNDALVLLPGTERAWVKSLWTPLVRWTEVTEEGLQGGPVMPDDYDGSARSITQLRLNVGRAGIVGSLVANDLRSSVVIVPLADRLEDGRPVDVAAYGRALEDIRKRFEPEGVRIHIVGFAKLAGDLIDGLTQVMLFFAAAAAIAAFIIVLHTRCWRSTLLLIASSLLGVLWLLGAMHALGFVLDPYSILVPFLIFSIGLSHGAQKMNGIMQDIGRGTHKYVAARYTFRRLFLAGLTALLTNVVGFAVLMVIDIPVIRELALATSMGVAILVFTKLLLVPVLLSYLGVSPAAARRSLREDDDEAHGRGIGHVWNWLVRFTEPRRARAAVVAAAILGVAGFALSLKLQVGDLDAGAPELRPESRYNLDNAFITAHYGLSSDLFAVMVKTPPGGCDKHAALLESDRLGWALRQDPAVQDLVSLPEVVRRYTAGGFEGSPKWLTLPRSQTLLNLAVRPAMMNNPELSNAGCAVTPVIAYLADHKAATLQRVLGIAEGFAAQHDAQELKFLPAAGSAGIEAVTNIVVKQANTTMLIVLYGAVTLLCWITFRSWRAVVVALVPLVITSFLCEALMVLLGIGVKVATLPVIALGVGVGVDYALYLLSVQLAQQRRGVPLRLAYRRAVLFTGKVVAMVGLTLAAGVITWAWSPIKFQADMGLLLTFMFVWNMVGALVLIPALSHYLLRTPGQVRAWRLGGSASREEADDAPTLRDAELLERITAAAREAGEAALAVYRDEIEVQHKGDQSPVTAADARAEAVILRHLAELTPGVPVISEEQAAAGHVPEVGRRFWLVDPLDGTKEFIQRNGEFTINIALVEDGVPRLGVVYAPAQGRMFSGAAGHGAAVEDTAGRRPIACRRADEAGLTVVSSRSHGDAEALETWLAGRKVAAQARAGSSLKFCLVAAGEADVYPRLGRTMEWDTAAGHAVLAAAGGQVRTLDGRELRYGKPGLDNPHFFATGLSDA